MRPKPRGPRPAVRLCSSQIAGSADSPAHPEREERRQDADEEDAAPAPHGHHDRGDDRGGGVADRPRALHESECLAAMLGGPRLGHQRRAAGPLTAHAQAEQDAEDGELPHRLREAARRGEHRVDEDASHQRPRPAEPVGDHPEDHPSRRGGEQGERSEQSGGFRVHRQVPHERNQDERVEHDVEGVQHPAERGRDQRPFCVGRARVPPAEDPGGRRRNARHQGVPRGRPNPPPPGDSMRSRSPAASVSVALPGMPWSPSLLTTVLRPGSPGSPPCAP